MDNTNDTLIQRKNKHLNAFERQESSYAVTVHTLT
jgi:hypothetical protein